MIEKDMRETLARCFRAQGCDRHADVALGSQAIEGYLAAILQFGAEVERRTIERCAKVAAWACMVEPDGGSPTEAECAVADEAARRILALQDAPSDSTPPAKEGV